LLKVKVLRLRKAGFLATSPKSEDSTFNNVPEFNNVPAFMRVGPRTEIEGRFLCGASTPSGPGIIGVLRSGVVTAGEILEADLLRPILAGEVFGDRDALPGLRDDWDAWEESH
jgi:hypothetical protein